VAAVWRGATSFAGDFVRLAEIPPGLRPYREDGPPVWLGGATPAALRRAGRMYDGWLPYPPVPADYESGLAQIRQAIATGTGDEVAAALARYVAAGARHLVCRIGATGLASITDQLEQLAGLAGRIRAWSGSAGLPR
jgi:alkanesulfonate monooxygenase SsuD/methylene tetrahydromethanopterin reductase-like flavin-dependent oxidoreductase (luciferase family)